MANMGYSGSIDQLKAAVQATGVQGEWSENERTYSFKTKAGSVLQWFADRSLTFQSGKDDLEDLVVAELLRREEELAKRLDAAPREIEYTDYDENESDT